MSPPVQYRPCIDCRVLVRLPGYWGTPGDDVRCSTCAEDPTAICH